MARLKNFARWEGPNPARRATLAPVIQRKIDRIRATACSTLSAKLV